ncbi:hypothetical protein [Thermococcus eurythermalis]|nr:hypothetical protein [Thermococcus eurythermalis]
MVPYWHSIKSFSAEETIKIGNQTFESYVNFTKPDEISRADYINGSLIQKVVIKNGIEKIVTSNGTFTLNATIYDVNALDPFAAILNNLDSFNVTMGGNTLILKPKKPGMPAYEVELNGKLPKKITIKQDGLVVVVEYRKITTKA